MRLLPGAGVALAIALAGCGSSSPAHRPSAFQMTHPQIVPTKSGHPDALYVPDPIRVRVGQTITWTNRDNDPHDVTADDGTFYSGPMAQGGRWSWTPTHAGTFTYFCTIHPEMHGEIIVSS